MNRPVLTVDLNAIAANWRALDHTSAKNVHTGAVIKANAYGLGARHIAPLLAGLGVRQFFVALTHEGAALRQTLGPGPTVNVFSGHLPGDTNLIRDHQLTPMLNSPAQWARHQSTLPGHPFGIQLDTGMSRLGLSSADWSDIRATALRAKPALIMSHLACADEPDHPMNRQQLTAFHALTDDLPVRRSLAATGGILLGAEYHFDITRPGIGLYGGAPFGTATPVAHLSIPIIQTRFLSPGDSVGYGNTWIATQRTHVATLAAGYADGLFRALSGGAQLYHATTPCPIVGRVSMDLITVDITHLTETPSALDILCPSQTIDHLAHHAQTIGYEILTSLGPRYQRRYKGA